MTLILTFGNKDHMTMMSDRRLSRNGRLVDDESNKSGVIYCLNARMVFGYTGLARWQSFETRSWLLKALHDSAEPDYTIGEILERVKTKATETFKNHPLLKSADPKFKRLSVMFSGYINPDGRLRQGCAILSNYHNFKYNSSFSEAQEEFTLNYASAKPDAEWPTLVQRVGNWHAMKNEDIDNIRELLSRGIPPAAPIGKSVEIINSMADNPKSLGSIGKQLMSVTIPSDSTKGVECQYISNRTKPETFFPSIVYLLPNQHMTVDNIKIEPVDDDTPPLSVPKVGKNQPCPCGSKIKYKRCHGKLKKKEENQITNQST